MKKEDIICDLMLNWWRSQEGYPNGNLCADDEERAKAYRTRIVRQTEAMMEAVEALKTLSNAGMPQEVAFTVLRGEHRTHQTDIICAALLVVQAFAKLELGTDARNETAIGLCKDIVAGFEDRMFFWRI